MKWILPAIFILGFTTGCGKQDPLDQPVTTLDKQGEAARVLPAPLMDSYVNYLLALQDKDPEAVALSLKPDLTIRQAVDFGIRYGTARKIASDKKQADDWAAKQAKDQAFCDSMFGEAAKVGCINDYNKTYDVQRIPPQYHLKFN